MKKLLLLFFVFSGFLLQAEAQQKTITGTVTGSEDKLPIIGATVMVRGTTNGVATDLNGKYSISVQEGAIIEVRYVGMKTKEITIGTTNVYDIALDYEQVGLDEVVVVGYGTQIKSKVTGSISKVDGESLKNIPVPTIEQALQGKSAGVFIESVNGKSTGTTRVRIRGSSSITADNQPLYVVDGIPISIEALNLSGAAINPMTSINPEDIESIDILKDAASAAIYGSRGANGVVIITTKKGLSGNTKLNFTVQSGFNQPSHKREFLNTSQFIPFYREAGINGDKQIDIYAGYPLGTSTYFQDLVETFLKTSSGWAEQHDNSDNYTGSAVNTNWQDQAFQKGKIFTVDFSARGGNDKLKYYASGSYNNTGGILISNGIEKESARLNVDDKINKFMDMGFSLNLNRTKIEQVTADNDFSTPMQLVALAPITPVRDLNKNLYDQPVTTYFNPLIDVEQAFRHITEYRTFFNGYLLFKLMDGLKWRNELGFDLYNLKENARYGENTDLGLGVNGYGFSNYGQTQNITAKSYLDFLKSFGQINVNAVLGTEMQYTTVEQLSAEGQEYPLDALKTLYSAGLITSAKGTLTESSFLSYFSRINLDYNAKYLLTLSGRVDGSSRFGKDNRYGFFPAASIGWVISKEPFLADNFTLSFLKVRTSYGLTGNAGIDNFGHLGLFGVGGYNSRKGLIPIQIANPDLGWESTNQFDAGIDFGFLKSRISGELDFYLKKTRDLLLRVPVPATSGYDSQMQNKGNVSNKGIEVVVNSTNLTGRLYWSSSLNFSYNKNEVTSLGGQAIIDGGSARYMNVVMVGQPIGVFYGAQYAGVNPANGDALWYINEKDANGHIVNPAATTNDFTKANFVVLGDPTPKYMGALTNTLGFKGIELTFTFQGVAGNKIHLIGDQWMASNGTTFDNQLTSQLRSWKNPGDITDVPEARLGWGNGNQSRNSRYISDGSYLKLRSLVLSYELPKNLLKKLRLDDMKLFVEGHNLLTITKYIGWDPEVSTDFLNVDYYSNNVYSGGDFYSAPQPRTFIVGISIGL